MTEDPQRAFKVMDEIKRSLIFFLPAFALVAGVILGVVIGRVR